MELTQVFGFIGLGAGCTVVLLGGAYFTAQRFVGHETRGLNGRVKSVEGDVEKHDERIRTVEKDISSIKTSIKSIDNKLDNLNGSKLGG